MKILYLLLYELSICVVNTPISNIFAFLSTNNSIFDK